MNRKRLLFVSNGYGEDLGAAEVVRTLPAENLEIVAYPLVGLGLRYPPGLTLLEPRRDFPSAGFGWIAGWRSFREDMAEGILSFWVAQRRTLRRQRGRFDLVAAAGDVYCLAMASAAGGPTVFLAGSKSHYVMPFNRVEVWLLRRLARQVFTRDELTAADLRRQGVNALSFGYWVMDALRFSGETFGIPEDRPAVTLLPGSKPPAFDNLISLLRAANAAAAQMTQAPAVLLAWAEQLSATQLRETVSAHGGVWADADHFRFDAIDVTVTTRFPDALRCATAVLGMAGAAHEQAAGLGKPVVAFPGTGPQFRPRFLEEQKLLLGDALVPAANWTEAGDALAALLTNPAECRRRGASGTARQGGQGGAAAIGRCLLEQLGLTESAA